jgi:hypothetical protein
MRGKQVLVSIRQTNGAAEAYDMAGKVTTSTFTKNLQGRFGDPSRLMWPTVEKHKPQVLASIDRSVTNMTEIINEALRDKGHTRGRPAGSPHYR